MKMKNNLYNSFYKVTKCRIFFLKIKINNRFKIFNIIFKLYLKITKFMKLF